MHKRKIGRGRRGYGDAPDLKCRRDGDSCEMGKKLNNTSEVRSKKERLEKSSRRGAKGSPKKKNQRKTVR